MPSNIIPSAPPAKAHILTSGEITETHSIPRPLVIRLYCIYVVPYARMDSGGTIVNGAVECPLSPTRTNARSRASSSPSSSTHSPRTVLPYLPILVSPFFPTHPPHCGPDCAPCHGIPRQALSLSWPTSPAPHIHISSLPPPCPPLPVHPRSLPRPNPYPNCK